MSKPFKLSHFCRLFSRKRLPCWFVFSKNIFNVTVFINIVAGFPTRRHLLKHDCFFCRVAFGLNLNVLLRHLSADSRYCHCHWPFVLCYCSQLILWHSGSIKTTTKTTFWFFFTELPNLKLQKMFGNILRN